MTSRDSTKHESFNESASEDESIKQQKLDDEDKEKLLNNMQPEEAENLLDELPDETRQALFTKFKVSMESSYRGPIPPPEVLSKFNDIIPDGADRIMSLAEKQSNHRMDIEKSVVNAKNIDSRLGVVFAGLIGLLGMLGGLYLIATGKAISGFIFSGGFLATLVGVYLRGTNLDVEDLKEKSEDENDI